MLGCRVLGLTLTTTSHVQSSLHDKITRETDVLFSEFGGQKVSEKQFRNKKATGEGAKQNVTSDWLIGLGKYSMWSFSFLLCRIPYSLYEYGDGGLTFDHSIIFCIPKWD